MKIKQFTAPTITEAMAQIKQELGEEAVIVSTESKNGSVCITVAVEEAENIDFNKKEQLEVSPSLLIYDDSKLRDSLEYHDILPEIAGQILALARQHHTQNERLDNRRLLAAALGRIYGFVNLLEGSHKNKIFMGLPGSGKSTVIAKLATKAKLKNIKIRIISTDNVRAGANNQLKAFAEILETDFCLCKTPKELFKTVQNGQSEYELQLIDTPGINPYIETEARMVKDLIDSIKADKILVADAGRNTFEAVETAEIFQRLGAGILLPTHLDMTRRIGAVISAAYCSRLNFCAGSVSSNIAKGLAEVTPQSLADLLLTE